MARIRTMNRRRWRKITPINGYTITWSLCMNGNLRVVREVLQGGKWRANSMRTNVIEAPSDNGGGE